MKHAANNSKNCFMLDGVKVGSIGGDGLVLVGKGKGYVGHFA